MNSLTNCLKKIFLPALCALLAAAGFAGRAGAVISPTINYQGYLISKVSNLPVETPQDLKFIIYPTATGISGALFSETVCNVRVTKGRYDVEVGSATGGIPAAIFADNSDLWMEVQVDADGDCANSFEAMSPRVKLQASPYAFSSVYATTSSVATAVFQANTIAALPFTDNGAITISTNLFVMGGISVGSISPGQTLAVAGIVESSTGGFKFPDGSIQTRAAAFTMWDLLGPNLYTINPGDVAIGESNQNPLARLHVSSAAGSIANLLMVSTGTSQLFLVNSAGEVHANSYYGDGTTLTGIVRGAGDNMTGPLTMAGSTITVTSPDGVLTPKVTFAPSVEMSSAPAAQYGGVSFSSNVYSAGTFYGDGAGLTGVISFDGTKVLKAGDTMTGQLTLSGSTLTVGGSAFSVGGSTLSVLGGYTSLGGAAYQTRLTVNGGITATSSITASGDIYGNAVHAPFGGGTFYSVTATSGTFWAFGPSQYSISTTSGIKVNGGGVEAPYFLGDGSMLQGVLKSTDTSKVSKFGDTMTGNLQISGSSLTVTSYGSTHKYAVTVGTASQYNMVVTTTGYVGVRVTDPSAPLEVDQNVVISNLTGANFGKAYLDLKTDNGTPYIHWYEKSQAASANGGHLGALGYQTGYLGQYNHFIYRANGSDPGNNGGEVFRIATDFSGNWKFGIGTDSTFNPLPREKFHVLTNVMVSTSVNNNILYISTASGKVSVSTLSATHILTVGGGILAGSSVTAQGGFFGDGAGLTNLQTASLPGILDVATITARAGSLYDGVVFSTAVYVQSKISVGELFEPQAEFHLRGVLRLDNKGGNDVIVDMAPEVAGSGYMRWTEVTSLSNKGVLGMMAGEKDLIYRANSGTLSSGGVQVFRIKSNGSFIVGSAGTGFTASAPMHILTNTAIGAEGRTPVFFVSTQPAYVGVSTGSPKEGLHVASSFLLGDSRPSARLYVSTATGYTGIGTGDPQAKLDVAGYSRFASSAVIEGSGLSGTQSALEVIGSTFVVRNDGTVGIGVASPAERLDVNGKVKAAGFSASREIVNNTCNGAATCTATCTAGKSVMGGGCSYAVGVDSMTATYPASDSTWQCDFSGATGNITAYAICSTVE